MQKKSILYIITKSVWGGASKYVYDLSISLRDDFDISIASGGQNQLYKKIKQNNIPYYQITNFQRRVNPFKDIFAFFEILGLLYQIKPDVIHVNSSKAGGIVGLSSLIYKILTGRKPRLIFTAHGWAFNEDRACWQIGLIKLFSKITSWFYDKVICVSEYDYQMALKHKITKKEKLVTIHNGIDLKNISFLSKKQAQKRLIGRESPLVIGTVAEWTKNKGLIYLIKAVQTLKLKDVDLVLIGSGENPDKEKMYSYDQKYNLDNVHLIEFIPQAIKYLKGFDIFVLPSLKEGLPYTIIEAMAAECPIIATKVGGIPEMIKNNINGSLVKPKNSLYLAEKISYLINNIETAQQMSIKARQKAEQEFSLEKMTERTKNLYS